jgi:prepilin-type N-terminal cleavage/methylation domain-containing protein
MKRGFTLLELIVVIIIIGILAILAFTQYTRLVERSRGAEARAILGDLRKMAYLYYTEHNTIEGIGPADLNIGTGEGRVPDSCDQVSHYFQYSYGVTETGAVTFVASRCQGSTGKPPGVPAGGPDELRLESRIDTGQDTWARVGRYDY